KPNIVTGTDPAAGKSISKGSTVKVFYNARPGAKAIPDVHGMSVADAETTLRSNGFTVVTQSRNPVPTVTDEQVRDAEAQIRSANLIPNIIKEQGPPGATPGTVWQESPNAQKVVLPGSTVNLYVVPGSAHTATPTPTPSSPSPTPTPTPTPSSPSPSQSTAQ